MKFVLINSFRQEVDDDVRLTDVNKHIVLQNNAPSHFWACFCSHGVHLLEDAKADPQIFNVVPLLIRVIAPSLRLRIKEYLKVLTSVLLSRLLISTWNYKIIYDYWALSSLVLIVVTWHQIFVVILNNVRKRTEVSAAIRSIITVVLKLTKWLIWPFSEQTTWTDRNDMPFLQSGWWNDLKVETGVGLLLYDVGQHFLVQHHGFWVTMNFVLHWLLWSQDNDWLILLIHWDALGFISTSESILFGSTSVVTHAHILRFSWSLLRIIEA